MTDQQDITQEPIDVLTALERIEIVNHHIAIAIKRTKEMEEENKRLRAELERYLSTLHRIGQLYGFDIFNAPFMARQAVEEK